MKPNAKPLPNYTKLETNDIINDIVNQLSQYDVLLKPITVKPYLNLCSFSLTNSVSIIIKFSNGGIE